MFRDITKSLIINGLKLLNVQSLRSIHSNHPILPFYHTVSDLFLPHITSLYSHKKINEFEQDLIFFQKYYTSISLKSIVKCKNIGKKILKFHASLTEHQFIKMQYNNRKLWETYFSKPGFCHQLYLRLQNHFLA